jgi:hypothetical protein
LSFQWKFLLAQHLQLVLFSISSCSQMKRLVNR